SRGAPRRVPRVLDSKPLTSKLARLKRRVDPLIRSDISHAAIDFGDSVRLTAWPGCRRRSAR
ncbi:MAG: hypothetical protein ACREXP_13980, partial [Steroidobacteraceae bacterium]